MALSSALPPQFAAQLTPLPAARLAPRLRCTIIPPYLLEALAASGDAVLERYARRTLSADTALRSQRSAPTSQPAPPAQPGEHLPVAATPGRARRSVHDVRRGTALPGILVRSEGSPPSGDDAADEAYAGLGSTYTLWWEEYQRDSLDGRGLPLVATVHYGEDYDNAFWDGDQMVFGDGDGAVFGRFTASLDVIGHELAHGVTQYTSGLVYRGQPGALNEHVSDVFGVLVAQRVRRQSAADADWLVGADLLLPGVSGAALRSMREPGTAYDDPRLGRDPQPAHMDDFVVTSSDFGGVHINSGIPNRAFVLAAEGIGGFAWEGAGRIWCDTITGDISADCDFATFAALTEVAAARRFGPDSPEHRAVREAWSAVGVVPAGGGDGLSDGSIRPRGRGPVHGDAEVLVRRSGGFAGAVTERRVRLEALAPEDARAWTALLTGPELRAAAARTEPTRGADRFWYAVCCDDPAVDVEVPEAALGEPTRSLIERTLRAR